MYVQCFYPLSVFSYFSSSYTTRVSPTEWNQALVSRILPDKENNLQGGIIHVLAPLTYIRLHRLPVYITTALILSLFREVILNSNF